VSPDLWSVVVRTLGLVSSFQAGGAALFIRLFEVRLPRSMIVVQRLGFWAAIVGVLLLVTHQELEAARMANEFSGLFDARMQGLAWHSNSGIETLLQMLGLVVIAAGLARPGHPGANFAACGTVIAACATSLSGHTSVHPQRALLAPLLALHVLLGSFWFGALLPLIVSIRRETREDALSVLKAFSAVAGPLVPCIGVAGLVMALTLVGQTAQWQTPYAALLLTKMAAFVALLGFAAWNRWRAVPAMMVGDARAAARSLQRSIALEYSLMFGVLGVTAVITTFYSP
jgi:putative copper resistance protein D